MNKKKTIVYILPRSPWPPYAGQARLAFYRARELKKQGYVLILIAFCNTSSINQNNLENLYKVFKEVHIIEIKKLTFVKIAVRALLSRINNDIPLQASWLNSPEVIVNFKKKLSYINLKYKNIFFHTYSIRSFFLWNIINKEEKSFVIDLVDSMTLNLKRKCNILNNFKKGFWRIELNAIEKFEQNLPEFDYCKNYLIVSDFDKNYLNFQSSNPKTSIKLSSIGYVLEEEIKTEFKKEEKRIIFFGSLSYEPNLSAIYWLYKKVLPIVWSLDPEICLYIAGRNPPKKLKKITEKDNNIFLISNPASMSKCIKESLVSVAPLISGSGQQFKIIEAMANKVPVITTSKAAMPFGFVDKKDLLIEDDPNNFAREIVNLCNDQKLIEKLSINAFKKIKNKFSWEAITKKLIHEIYK